MSIELDETIRAILYRSGDECDWMCGVHEMPDGTIRTVYRFRYDHPDTTPDEANSDKDQRNWYEMTSRPGSTTADHVITTMQTISDKLGEAGFTPKGGCACKLVRGKMTVDQFVRAFTKLPFVHLRSIEVFKDAA